MARKKNPAIKATGATSSKAAPLPDWVKGNAPKPAPSYTKPAAAPPPAKPKAATSSSTPATAASTSTLPAQSQAQPDNRPPPLFPPGVKVPIALLNERIQKHHANAGWQRAVIEPRKAVHHAQPTQSNDQTQDGEDDDDDEEPLPQQQQAQQQGGEAAWSACVILTKTNKADASKPFIVRLEPKNKGESMTQWTVGERGKDMAKQLGAVYALFRLCSNLSLNRVLPQGGPREYWTALEAYKAAAPAHQAWMWAAEPFEAAAKRVAETALRTAKREKEAAARERGEPSRTGGKRWEEAREVRMSAKLRERTEACVRNALQVYPEAAEVEGGASGASTPKGGAETPSEGDKGVIDEAALASLVSKLTRLGFRAGHARIAARWVFNARSSATSSTPAEQALKSGMAQLSDEQAALEYLVLFTPEEDLPVAFAPSKNSEAFVTSSTSRDSTLALAVRWGAERLAKYAGFPNKAVGKVLDELESRNVVIQEREAAALDVLLCRLVGDEEGASAVLEHAASRVEDVEAAQELERKRGDERLALGAVLGEERVVAVPDAELSLSARELPEQAYDVLISARGDKEDVRLRITPGKASRYPCEGETSLPTFYVASSTLPAYLRLALTARLVKAARTQPDWLELLDAGEGGLALAMAEELEMSWAEIVDNPPDLARIMSGLVEVPAPKQSTTPVDAPRKSTRKVETQRPPRVLRRDANVDAKLSVTLKELHASKAYAPMGNVRAALPAAAARENILKMLSENRVVIIAGETGCGKTTQVPQFILDEAIERNAGSMCNIIVTQPRRVSAMGVATRVAEERCEKIGQGLVGYAIKGERKASRDCRLQFSTTGVLLRRLATGDTELAGLSHIIVDEVHERSVDSDFLLLELRKVLQRNPTLKVVLMSATIDQQTFSRYFNGAPGLEIPGRTFPVQDIYLEDLIPQARYRPSSSQRSYGGGAPSKPKSDKQLAALRASLEATGMDESDMQTVQSISSTDRIDYDLIGATVRFICEKEGDTLPSEGAAILVFVPGVGEIRQAMDSIRSAVSGRSRNVDIIPLHANLSPEDQRRVFVPSRADTRKIVVSTNVAEASITIPEASYVIDCGRVKETRFEPESGLTRLVECWASRASCRQRRGRAGRTRAGQCFKLFTRITETNYMAPQQTPEMQRVPLEALFLQAKAMRDKVDIKMYLGEALSPPSLASMDKALEILQEVGAIHPGGFDSPLTALGRHLSNLPLDLRLGKMLILGSMFGCLAPMLSCAAIMSCKPLFLAPYEQREESSKARAAFAVGNSDLLTDAAAFAAWAQLRAKHASNAEMREFCEKNFLSQSSLRDIQSTRSELLSQLEQLGFVSRSYNASAIFGKGTLDALDAHSRDVNLQKSLILAGLWPSVVRIALPPAKFDQAASGTVLRETVPKEVKYFDNDGRIFVHPSSVLFNPRSSYTSSYLAVFKKSASGEGSKRYLRDGTEAPLYALLLFGGQLQIHHMIGGISVGRVGGAQQGEVDVRLRSNARIGVLCGQLRRLLDAIMAQAFESPADGAVLQADAQAADVIDCMRALVANDGLD